ncbi:MAG: ABC transporter substrate-binding protein [Candidatus Vecturithrix sp.]|jgi:peptide/nickel transport system substrate-binding protein|nr:ABC transporter substrate-binding protein [Candidatus Vecturithrix sp.]
MNSTKKITVLVIAIFCLLGLTSEFYAADLAVPVEYPEGRVMPGGREAKTFALDEMIVYKALPAYSQPAWMDKLVQDGTLPPVEERLPKEPQVQLASGMSDGIGTYGGVWREFSAVPTEGWNLGAGQTQGWFGINAIFDEPLVIIGPIFLRNDGVEPLPNLAKSWEWQEDGKILIMHLIEGAKWSDGDPFDADDVMFTWEDMILDPNVRSWTRESTWQIDGEPITLEALDKYTLKWTFPEAYPIAMLYNMSELNFYVSPSHWLKPKHPKYNKDMDYVSFENCMPPTDLPVPTLGPWVPVSYKTDEFMVMRRNPYYWKVDEEGKQLPYIDEVTFQKGTSGVGRTMGTMSGSLDHDNVENPEVFVEMMKKAADPNVHFYLEWGPELLAYDLELNLSANLGVKDERDAALRTLFRDLRFRKALSYAIDREGLAQSLVRGPFLRGFAGSLYPGCPYFDRASVVYYPYHVESAKLLLADLGLKDTDNNGILNWTEGPLAGQDVIIQLVSHEDQAAAGILAETLVNMFRTVGIQINYRPVTSAIGDVNMNSGNWEMRVFRIGQEFAVPFARWNQIAPIMSTYPLWHRAGAEPRELLPFEPELINIVTEFSQETDFEKQKALMFEYNRIATENCYNIGLVVGRYGLALAKRFKNIPIGTPAFMYQWDWNNWRGEQVWASPEDAAQYSETAPNTIPVYSK